MALALGVVPVGVAAPQWYRRLYSAPALPADVADVGLLFQPNFETLRELRPTLLLVTPGHLMAKAQLEQIAAAVGAQHLQQFSARAGAG
ncbi:Iron(III)-hydroxamate-binding protein fhuD [Ewingella americana]|uniref:Iron(III)-hydroxamate-binding protein fhuD n=1 Tax=Ewingella americana TaxID=41202 RepID=A0A377NB30_9GAMM|nr:Iron(III)-hydroxamate-binding protein fhuD [Ewingella americana]